MASAYRFRPMHDTEARLTSGWCYEPPVPALRAPVCAGKFQPERLTLSVAAPYGRAMGVYGRAGFRRGEVFVHQTNGGEREA